MSAREWSDFDATMVCEGCNELAGIPDEDLDAETVLSAWQHLVNTGLAWKLQGSFGRMAASLINEGLISAAA